MCNTVAIIHTQVGPYHLARAYALAQTYQGAVKLIQLASQEACRHWVVDSTVSTSNIYTVTEGILEQLDPVVVSKKLVELLNALKPDVLVIAGYAYPAMRRAARWAHKNNITAILLSDSQYIDRPRFFVKELIKSYWICKYFQAAFVAGASAELYLETLGFPRSRIWRGYDVVDNNYFTLESSNIKSQPGNLDRKTEKLPDRYFLYVGRFSDEKNLVRLIKAYYLYHQKNKQEIWSLVMVGSGSQETQLKAKAKELNIQNIFWIGFKQIDELPLYYSLASALVLPSISEPWGLVVNEAMACGLPILISDRCGCVLDLVFPGINGYIFDPYSVQAISDALLYMSNCSESKNSKMQKYSRQIIENYSLVSWSEALTDCIQVCQARKYH